MALRLPPRGKNPARQSYPAVDIPGVGIPLTQSRYNGFNALYGNKYVSQVVGPIQNLVDGSTITGFPGFDGMNAANSLSYVAAMQENGVPVTFAYISDLHDLQGARTHTALGPGEQPYVQQLQAYDTAFAKFFANLAAHGINKSNTLFVFTADEGDHFTGGPPTPANCTGATIDRSTNPPTVIPGNYSTYDKTPSTTPPGPPFGEVAAGLQGLLALEGSPAANDTFTVGNDTAPAVYLQGQPPLGDPTARTFEQDTGAIRVVNPLRHRTESLTQYMADPVEMNILHMVTADPARTPTFTLFARPDYYVAGTCSGGYNSDPTPNTNACVLEEPAYAWLHGNIQPDITTTWLGMVGPGVRRLGVTARVVRSHRYSPHHAAPPRPAR